MALRGLKGWFSRKEEEDDTQKLDPTAAIFYFFPPAVLEAILPTPRLNHQSEDPNAVASVELSAAHIEDPYIPIMYVVPKSLFTAAFPPFNAPVEALTSLHVAANYICSATFMAVICLTT